MRKLWDKFVAWLLGIPEDKRLHFFFGTLVASFFAIALEVPACLVPTIVVGGLKEIFDKYTTQEWDWHDFVATCLGGLMIQFFVLLHYWWF